MVAAFSRGARGVSHHGEQHTAPSGSERAVCPLRPNEKELFNQDEDAPPVGAADEVDAAEGEADAGQEAQVPKPRKAPHAPSAEMVAAHRMSGHAVYRSWCRECVQGRGHNAPHYNNRTPGADELPVISFDYGFLGAKNKAEDEQCERDGQIPSWRTRTRLVKESML